MCGILGIVGREGQPLERERFLRSRDTMTHRGPDDGGLYVDGPVMLGHRRLSIIDLGGGHQPMSAAEGAVWIVFNGEIYNFRELRAELAGKGHAFKTTSDTEVILQLYLEAGVSGFERLNGIFAFAIWDRRSGELHLVRDQLGIKPLYYADTPRGLVFASEIKTLLATGLVQPELESAALPEYLVFRDVSGERTLFRGVRRLLPGHRLTLRGACIATCRYWDLVADDKPGFDGRFEEAVDALESLLDDAVRMQMVSDVPLGTFCSGGVDSSQITARAARPASAPINTFSVGFDEAAFDESVYARRVAAHCGTRHHEIRISNRQFADNLETLIWYNDEPLHFPNSVHIHAVSQLARRHVTVVLTGEGADELFAGYPRYQIPVLLARWRRVPTPVRRLASRLGRTLGDHRLQKLERFTAMPAGWEILMNSASADAGRLGIPALDERSAVSDYRRAAFEATAAHPDPVTRVSLLDQQTYLVSILNRQDKMSMATSIESRVPFLDPRVVRFAHSLPTAYKLGRLDNKRIVKALALRHLPAEVIKRRKSGFGVPLADWFRADEGLGKLLVAARDNALVGEVFGKGALAALHDEHRSGRSDHSDALWAALNLALWCQAFGIGVNRLESAA
jgi:asparagine synthase (glutamine-hydrolysing)